MTAEREEMVAALRTMEDGLQRTAAGLARYLAAYGRVSAAAYATHGNQNRQLTLESALGAGPVHDAIVRRLRALGLRSVLERARTPGTLAETWVTDLTTKIRAFVA